ncbi:hypothetical protein DFJ74DRAFT_773827 [Hyaloraphidium curvatum]|nr:hypothetical protein DFJ74DRAFT_773827 [Hyaloraphidium curvatum]
MAPAAASSAPAGQRNLSRKVAIVTGASSGFGAGISRALAKRGCIVVMGDLDEANGQKLADELQENAGELDIGFYHFLKTDVSDLAQVRRLFQFAEDKFGGYDIVVNNAGIGDGDKFFHDPDSLDSTAWTKMVAVNVNAVIYGTQLAVRSWLASGKRGGCVVNTASAAALRPVQDAEVYAATKSAVYHFSRSLGHLAAKGIRVNAICPSAVATPLWRSLKNIPPVGADEATWKRMEERAAKLSVEDVVAAMMFAVDDESLAGQGLFIHGKGKIDVWTHERDGLGKRLRGEVSKI